LKVYGKWLKLCLPDDFTGQCCSDYNKVEGCVPEAFCVSDLEAGESCEFDM
jgi:hypothetical protein